MEYESKATTTKISATSRSSIKIRDSYYTTEATEERTILSEDADIEKEWQLLFDSVNAIIDNQCEEIVNTFKN